MNYIKQTVLILAVLLVISACGGGAATKSETGVSSGPIPSVPSLNAYTWDLSFRGDPSPIAQLPTEAAGCDLVTSDAQIIDAALTLTDGRRLYSLEHVSRDSLNVVCEEEIYSLQKGETYIGPKVIARVFLQPSTGEWFIRVFKSNILSDALAFDRQQEKFIASWEMPGGKILLFNLGDLPVNFEDEAMEYVNNFVKIIDIQNGDLIDFRLKTVARHEQPNLN